MDVRRLTTKSLAELVRMDPLCALYRRRDELDPAGIHLVTVEKEGISRDLARGINVDRLEVSAKLRTERITVYLEIPHHYVATLPMAIRP